MKGLHVANAENLLYIIYKYIILCYIILYVHPAGVEAPLKKRYTYNSNNKESKLHVRTLLSAERLSNVCTYVPIPWCLVAIRMI